jgi:hypothetical protein
VTVLNKLLVEYQKCNIILDKLQEIGKENYDGKNEEEYFIRMEEIEIEAKEKLFDLWLKDKIQY